MSSALFVAIGGGRGFAARFPSKGTGSTRSAVVKLALLASTPDASIPIRSETLRTSASSVLSTFNWNGPTSRISPEARASFSSTGLPLSFTGFSGRSAKR